MGTGDGSPRNLALLADEQLAALCGQGIEAAERELIRRQMQAIYWLPRRAFGAPEEELSGFLLYAIEKIRGRDILAKFDPDQGTRFRTWFGVVIRRLYLDDLRTQGHPPAAVELQEDGLAGADPSGAAEAPEDELLAAMQVQCRALFKLLLCNTCYLTPEEIRWVAQTSGASVLEAAEGVARLEERLRNAEVRLRERYDRLAVAHWWKTTYERQLQRLETELEHPWTEAHEGWEKTRARLDRRRQEYERLVHDLSGGAGIATAPYRELAALLGLKEGTLASQISRCRARAAEWLLRRQR